MAIAFVPVFIRMLGVEAWGLIGFMVTLNAWFALLDLGLTPTLAREFARLTGGQISAYDARSLLRVTEIIVAGLGFLVLLIIALLAEGIVTSWLKPVSMHVDDVIAVVRLIGIVVAARLMEQVYRGVFQGIQAQVAMSAVTAAMATLRWVGSLGVLHAVNTTTLAFFAWHASVSAMTLCVMAFFAYARLPPAGHDLRHGLKELGRVRRFAGGIATATIFGVAFAQADKALLSGILPLADFGYYMVASSVAAALYFVIAPIVTALQPRLVVLAERSDRGDLRRAYLTATQWLAAAVVPAGATLIVFADVLLLAWSGDTALVSKTTWILRWLAAGMILNGLIKGPATLCIAFARTRAIVLLNLLAFVAITLLVVQFVDKDRVELAAQTWFCINLVYLAIIAEIAHGRFLIEDRWRWLLRAIVTPLTCGVLPLWLRVLVPAPCGTCEPVALPLVGFAGAMLASVLLMPDLRQSVLRSLGLHR